MRSSRTVGDRLTFDDVFAFGDDGKLINASALIRADEFLKFINVEFIAGGVDERVINFNFDMISVHFNDGAGAFSENHNAGVASGFEFHAGPDERGLSFK